MKDRAHATELGRLDKACAKERHRNIGNIEIDLHSATHEERPRQERAKLSTPYRDVECRDTENDECCRENRHHCLYPSRHAGRASLSCCGQLRRPVRWRWLRRLAFCFSSRSPGSCSMRRLC